MSWIFQSTKSPLSDQRMRVPESDDRPLRRLKRGPDAQEKRDLRDYCDYRKALLDGEDLPPIPSRVQTEADKLIKKYMFDRDFSDQMWYRGPA